MSTAIDTLLSRSPDVCGGRMRIDGTRVTIHQVATCYQRGLTAEEIVEQFPHTNLAQVYAALAYYHANRGEIDHELEAEVSDFLRLAQESKLDRCLVIAFALAEVLVHAGERVGVPALMRPTGSRNVLDKMANAIVHDTSERASLPPDRQEPPG